VCSSWRKLFSAASAARQQSGIVSQKAALGDATVVLRDRLSVFAQAPSFLRGPNKVG
jgi:hypothetical protein